MLSRPNNRAADRQVLGYKTGMQVGVWMSFGGRRCWTTEQQKPELELCSGSFVPIMETTYLWYRDDASVLRRIDGAGIRRVLFQCQMGSGSMVILQEVADNASEMRLAEDDNMVEAFPAQRPDDPFHVRRLPGTSWGNDNFLDVKCLHLILKREAIDSIPISQEVARVFSIIKGLNQLPGGPGGGRMFGHVKVQDSAPIMCKNNKDEQDPEGSRGYGEEIDRNQFPEVVVEKNLPVLRRRFPSFWHPSGNGPFRDFDSKLQ